MSIYYTMTFWLLAAEIAAFCFLLVPLPHQVRQGISYFFARSLIAAKVVEAIKIALLFVAILFADAIQRMSRANVEYAAAKSGRGTVNSQTESSLAAKKFYSERNAYLTGFCLFLSLVLVRTVHLMRDLSDAQGKLRKTEVSSSH